MNEIVQKLNPGQTPAVSSSRELLKSTLKQLFHFIVSDGR